MYNEKPPTSISSCWFFKSHQNTMISLWSQVKPMEITCRIISRKSTIKSTMIWWFIEISNVDFMGFNLKCGFYIASSISSGWWFQPTPLKNDGVRHLGWWTSQLIWKNHIHVTSIWWLPSGKHTKNYGKSPFLMGKLTINGHLMILHRPHINQPFPPRYRDPHFQCLRHHLVGRARKPPWIVRSRCSHVSENQKGV